MSSSDWVWEGDIDVVVDVASTVSERMPSVGVSVLVGSVSFWVVTGACAVASLMVCNLSPGCSIGKTPRLAKNICAL